MADIFFNPSSTDSKFKLSGSGHVTFKHTPITGELLAALMAEPANSDFFLPDLIDVLSADAIEQLREAFKTQADPITYKAYQVMMGQFASMQVSRKWVLTDLVPVWRAKIHGALIEEIIRVKDGSAYVIVTGTNELLSEHDLYRRTLKTIGEHLDSAAEDYAVIAKYTKLTLASPIVERKVCVTSEKGISTISAWGPACLDSSQWELPAGYTFLTTEA